LRRIAVIVSLLVCSLLLTAVALAGKPRFEQKRLRPTDMALAKRTTLRASDLSAGWVRRTPSAQPDELPNCPGADLDFSAFTITGKAQSRFAKGGAEIESFVEVFKSRSDASGDYRKGTASKLLACLGPELRRQARKAGLDMRLESARLVSRPAIGDRAFQYRIVASVRTDTSRLHIYVDVIGFQRGRTLVGVYFSGTKPVAGQLAAARSIAARAR
jgi:hypothetical protein